MLRFRSRAAPESVRAALASVWGPDSIGGDGDPYVADTDQALGLHLYVFRAARQEYDEYEVILIREPHVSRESAGGAWGSIAGTVHEVLSAIEAGGG